MNDYEQMQHAREVLAQVSAPRDPGCAECH